jgi:putative DNA primase/helicase
MINLITGETQPFDPKFMSTTKIPVNYDHGYPAGVYADFFRMVEGKELPKIMSFLYEIMDLEDVELFLDYLAYCLWREYRYNFWMLLVGKGFNGKSVLLDLIERFFGSENKSGETLRRLLTERFSVANLYNKMVNVDADVSADVIFNNTGVLKKLTGNDLHVGEHKFKKPFYFRNHAKLFFSCNKIPETGDDTDAFFRRIFIINFSQQFFGKKNDPHLIDKISTDDQLSILLSELISRLPRIIEHGLRQVTNEALEETYDKFTRGSDPVKYYYETALQPEIGSKISKLDMYNHYEEFCKLHRLTPESDQSFSRKMTKVHGLKIGRPRINHELIYCYMDIKLKDLRKTLGEQDNLLLNEISDLTEQQKEELK